MSYKEKAIAKKQEAINKGLAIAQALVTIGVTAVFTWMIALMLLITWR